MGGSDDGAEEDQDYDEDPFGDTDLVPQPLYSSQRKY